MNFDNHTLEDLQQYVWDYHKDVHGFRPRYLDLTTRENCVTIIKMLDDYMDHMKSTPEGRAQLREEGWNV